MDLATRGLHDASARRHRRCVPVAKRTASLLGSSRSTLWRQSSPPRRSLTTARCTMSLPSSRTNARSPLRRSNSSRGARDASAILSPAFGAAIPGDVAFSTLVKSRSLLTPATATASRRLSVYPTDDRRLLSRDLLPSASSSAPLDPAPNTSVIVLGCGCLPHRLQLRVRLVCRPLHPHAAKNKVFKAIMIQLKP